ncbi:hypothetical protein GCM10007315_23510 [Gemmobacter tilapiae]|uniref:Uncharacterized protein n=1 Tax=Neogemmobacter tilapiae TaxID=875041 RepID=A0A918TRM2_9RHOB|nr:hypothetical protein GCM10007315_23510 [Gemmobacter tilapiae]
MTRVAPPPILPHAGGGALLHPANLSRPNRMGASLPPCGGGLGWGDTTPALSKPKLKVRP